VVKNWSEALQFIENEEFSENAGCCNSFFLKDLLKNTQRYTSLISKGFPRKILHQRSALT
jgi:hypothetical protein